MKKFLILIGFIFIISIAGVSASDDLNQSEILQTDGGTFADLQNMIDNASEGSTINLENDYVCDSSDSITINKDLTINGNGFTIDGNGKVRIMDIGKSTVVLNNINFINGNTNAQYSGGGAIKCKGDLTINNCSFVNNTADSEGGAIQCSGNLNVDASNFMNNRAEIAGAVHWFTYDDETYIRVCNSSFVNNSAQSGGAIYSYGDFVVNLMTIDNSTFVNNSAHDSSGGAIWGHFVNININDSNFVNNIAKDVGGSIYCMMGPVSAIDSNFISNSAESGGAIYYFGDYYDYIEISDSSFVNNSAQKGGAILSFSNVNIGNTSFIENKADEGNVIYFDGGLSYDYPGLTILLTDLEIDGNASNVYGGGITFDENILSISAQGVGVYASGEVSVGIAGESFKKDFDSKGKVSFDLSSISSGTWDTNISYLANGDFSDFKATIPLLIVSSQHSFNLTVPDVEKYFNGPERFAVNLTDSDNRPVANATVSIIINGNTYNRTTDENGIASMAINLNSGVYEALTKYNDFEVSSTITVKATVSGENITKIFRNGTQYYATFVDTQGKTLANGTEVEFNINGVFYKRYTNENGTARMNINLNPGEYIITAKNPNSTEQYTNIITVLPSIVENNDLTKYYKNGSQYTLKILGDDGSPVKSGVEVKFNINGVFYTRTTNESGYVKMNINLEPGEYIITAEYNGLMASNNITVLSVIETENLTMKYADGSYFNATILDGQGKPLANANVTFNINGVFYNKVTDGTGVAHLKINLMAGEYIITTSYNGLNAANKVTISS